MKSEPPVKSLPSGKTSYSSGDPPVGAQSDSLPDGMPGMSHAGYGVDTDKMSHGSHGEDQDGAHGVLPTPTGSPSIPYPTGGAASLPFGADTEAAGLPPGAPHPSKSESSSTSMTLTATAIVSETPATQSSTESTSTPAPSASSGASGASASAPLPLDPSAGVHLVPVVMQSVALGWIGLALLF
jgi:hypothetical protein